MILYHGTNIDFRQIRLDMSRVGKDFGFGFYLTPDQHVATRQAERKLLQFGTGTKVVQSYFLDEEKLTGLKVLRFDSYTEAWADFILLNRQNKEIVHCTIMTSLLVLLLTIRSGSRFVDTRKELSRKLSSCKRLCTTR